MDWVTIFLISLLSLLVFVLLFVREKQKKQIIEEVKKDVEELQEVPIIQVDNPTETDLKAYELIKEYRSKIWWNVVVSTDINPRMIYQLAYELVREIARLYYPLKDRPEFQASLHDLAELNYRISERIRANLETFPFNKIKDFNIENILKYKNFYNQVTSHSAFKFFKKHKYLYDIGKALWAAYNYSNPWYWGRQVLITVSQESIVRYFLSMIMTVVGEEAILLYSRRGVKPKSAIIEYSIAGEMINMAVADGLVTSQEYETLLAYILKNTELNDSLKVSLLRSLLAKKPASYDLTVVSEKGDKARLLRQVEKVAQADEMNLTKKMERLRNLEERLGVSSKYRNELEKKALPSGELDVVSVQQINKKREAAILKLMVQAATACNKWSESLKEYIWARALAYPLVPFSEAEFADILVERERPTDLKELVKVLDVPIFKQQALLEVLDVLLWQIPFTKEDEAYYYNLCDLLGMKKEGEKHLIDKLKAKLPKHDLISTPPFEILRYIFRELDPTEGILAIRETSTRFRFRNVDKTRARDAYFWIVVTTRRLLAVATAQLQGVTYRHSLEFGPDTEISVKKGRFYDEYTLKDPRGTTLTISNTLFGGAGLERIFEVWRSK
ncbi:MAG TPA: hypothetical protein VNM22_10840 [Candidatus Limnocylindrales bacterium]|nr:hypothetical protein [Candidatus Limnocylindrales bacterium]